MERSNQYIFVRIIKFFNSILFLTALQNVGVVIPSIISLSSPLVTLTFYYLTRREKIEKRLVIGVSLITIGSIVSTMKYLIKI